MHAKPWSSAVQTSGQICIASLTQVIASCWSESDNAG